MHHKTTQQHPTMDSNTEVILVPVNFLKGIEDKVKHVKEKLMGKQALLSKVNIYLLDHKT